MRLVLATVLLLTPTLTQAQWEMQDPHVTADLRGIDYVGNGVAWASGSHGTVLRTQDMGKSWQLCTTPPDAEDLDFRGVQAFDTTTAIVMSSGPGDKSRLYKTIDGCQTWKLVFTDPYGPQGFFDALVFVDRNHGLVFGDPTAQTPFVPSVEYAGNFRIRVTGDGGTTWGPVSTPDTAGAGHGLHALPQEGAFAASNSNVTYLDGHLWFATSAARVSERTLFTGGLHDVQDTLFRSGYCAGAIDPISRECGQPWTDFIDAQVPIQHSSSSSGIFSLAFRDVLHGVAVGGNYTHPSVGNESAAGTSDGGKTWSSPGSQPSGYRSAVEYDKNASAWITVGPNGTDVSTDDGRNWHPLKPGPGDAPDADKNWNALSLPFVVGPHGRIGILRDEALARPGVQKLPAKQP